MKIVGSEEGIKVGLVKNLSMIGNVTVTRASQTYVIKGKIFHKLIRIEDIASNELKDYTKVFLNGEWIGMTNEANILCNDLKTMKLNNTIENTTGIVYDIERNELQIRCDGGRLYRPALRVEDNKVLLTKKHIDMISIEENASQTMITSWNEFLIKNPGIIEYVDMEETPHSMISMTQKRVKEMYDKMNNSAEIVKNLKDEEMRTIVNRYDETSFVRFTHCEIHPTLMAGVVVSNIPFYNSNQAPRNMFQYSQARQAIGLYTSNYRDRLDISYVLYHPQKPIVNTRLLKYINTDTLTSGENAVVAIACYTGYEIDCT